MQFSLSWDRTTQILSSAVILLLISLAALIHNIGLDFLAAALVILAYAWSPRSYVISSTGITVRRLIGNVTIPLAGIRTLRRATPDDLKGAIRIFGNGGLFGYYGKFRTSALGICTWYITNRRNVVVAIGAPTCLFSPDDVDGFLTAFQKVAPHPHTDSPEPRPVPAATNRTPLIAGVLFAAITLAIVGLSLFYSPGLPTYTISNGELFIHDRFYPVTLKAQDLDLANAAVVDIGPDADWHPVARTNGFANLHYRSGWFRVANGQRVRLYVSDGKRVVLLPPKGTGSPVLLQVPHPEEFVEQIRRAMS